MRSKLTGIVMLLCFYVHAQQNDDSLYLSPGNFMLDEMIISANRWEQNLREVPNKITTVSLAKIRFQNPQTAADLLGASNNVFIQKSQLGGGSPVIRGFATNRVLLVVDGVRMNNAIFRSGNVQNVISLDANAVQEAEVVFGPGSVMYGSDAIGGVMDFHTLKPVFSNEKNLLFKANALTRYSSANKEKTAHVDFNIGLKKWSFLTSITRSDYDNLTMGSRGPEEYIRPDYVDRENGEDVVKINRDPDNQIRSGYDQWNAMQKISFQATPALNFTYSFHYSKTSDYARYDRLILREDGGLSNAEWYYGPQKWIMHSLIMSYADPFPVADALRMTVAYQDYEESRHNRGFGSSRRTNRFERVKALSANIDLDKNLNDQVTVYYGGEFITNEVGSTAYGENVNNGEITPVSTRYPDGADWRSYAAYLNLKVRLNHVWQMNLSSRFTAVYTHAQYDTAFFDFPFIEATLRNKAMNGSFGLIYSPTDQWKIFTNLSTGFRAPNVDDIGKVFDSEPGNVVVPNPGLEPEQAYSVEVGAVGIIKKNLKVDLGAYYTTIDNAIARASSTFNGEDSIFYDGELSRVLSLQNISHVNVYGIQAGIDWQVVKAVKLTSNINFQKGKEKDAETGRNYSPTHVAPLFGATHIIFTRRKVKADIYANYNGEIAYEDLALSERGDAHLYAKDQNGNPYSPRWFTMNFKASYQVSQYFSVDGGIENIFDKRYRPYTSGISSPGRNFIIALRASF